MENWSIFGKTQEVENKKPSIFKDYIVPLGSVLIPIITYLTQSSLPWWGSLAIAVYVAIVIVFLVVPTVVSSWKRWRAYLGHKRLEKRYIPKIIDTIGKFRPMLDSHRTGSIWYVWDDASRTSEMQEFICPNRSCYCTLVSWLEHLRQSISSKRTSDFKLIASEASGWVQQYASLCREAFSQFESLIRSGQFDESKVRQVRQNWNHVRDEHNQAINSWKDLCSEINTSFGEKVCADYYETMMPLE